MSGGISRPEVYLIVNRYIGVSGGYLGDFSYQAHAEFYPEYCDLDIDPYTFTGTTRARFIAILEGSDSLTQARIIRGILEKYPPGSSELRTAERGQQLSEIAARLESGGGVASASPKITSDVVNRAIADAEALLRSSGAPSGVDRMHTAFHGFLQIACSTAGIAHGAEPSVTELFKLLRRAHPALQEQGPHGAEVERVVKAFASAVDSLNTLRNNASVAHPNAEILAKDEALLYINAVRTLMAYLDAKLAGGVK